MFADQALASLRIETLPLLPIHPCIAIRLSRACGLKHELFLNDEPCGYDQALASLRIETNLKFDGNFIVGSGSREPAD